jgi:hypothetical protein
MARERSEAHRAGKHEKGQKERGGTRKDTDPRNEEKALQKEQGIRLTNDVKSNEFYEYATLTHL